MITLFLFLSLLILLITLGTLISAIVSEQTDKPLPMLATLLLRILLGTTLAGWWALLLAEFGHFSRLTWLAGLAGFMLIAGVVGWRSGKLGRHLVTVAEAQEPAVSPTLPLPFKLPAKLEPFLLLLLLIPSLWLYFRPHQYVTGAADVGVYFNIAAHIANEGSIQINDPLLAALPSDAASLLTRGEIQSGSAYLLPAFFVTDQAAGEILPQFFHLHPAWQAVAYAFGGGMAALRLNGLWALLALFTIYMGVRQLAGWQTAILTAVALMLCGLQVWFARYTTTEILTQFLLWGGLWSFTAWSMGRQPVRQWGLAAGLALGSVLLVRIDMYFLLGLPALPLIWRLLSSKPVWNRADGWFLLPLLLLTLHSFLHAVLLSPVYVQQILAYVELFAVRFWYAPLAAIFILAVAATWIWSQRAHLDRLWVQWNRPVRLATISILIALALYAYFIRPIVGAAPGFVDGFSGQEIPRLDHETLTRLGWYLSPAGIALGVAGICLMLWHNRRITMPIWVVGIFFSLLYLWRFQANPHQVYVMRRHLPIIIPFMLVGGSYALMHLLAQQQRWRQLLSLLLMVVWLGLLGWNARGLVTQVDHATTIHQLDELANKLPAGSILIFHQPPLIGIGDILATPLRFQYGIDAYVQRGSLDGNEALFVNMVRQWQNAGRTVVWVNPPAEQFGLTTTALAAPIVISSETLETSYQHRPVALIQSEWRVSLFVIDAP